MKTTSTHFMMVFGSGKSEAGEKRSKKKKAVLPVFDS
jgi:hypothetical protein